MTDEEEILETCDRVTERFANFLLQYVEGSGMSRKLALIAVGSALGGIAVGLAHEAGVTKEDCLKGLEAGYETARETLQ